MALLEENDNAKDFSWESKIEDADEIEKAVKAVLADGYRTVDIMSDGMKKVGCKEMGQLIIDKIK